MAEEVKKQPELTEQTIIAVKQKAVDEVLEYSQKSIHRSRKQIKGLILMLLTLSCLIAIGVCLICDFAINGKLWWSVIVIGSVIYGWALLVPLFGAKHRQVVLVTDRNMCGDYSLFISSVPLDRRAPDIYHGIRHRPCIHRGYMVILHIIQAFMAPPLAGLWTFLSGSDSGCPID